jgi:type I restriction enzyme S subunit
MPHRSDPGDVLVTKMGDPPGVAAVHDENSGHAIITADIIRLRPDPKVASPRWLSIYINSPDSRRQIVAMAGGVTRQKLTLRDFRTLRILLPSMASQLRVVSAIGAVDNAISSEGRRLSKLRKLKSGIMSDLLTGRIRVRLEAA